MYFAHNSAHNESQEHFLKKYFAQNSGDNHLHFHVTEIKAESEIEIIIKARNIIRKNPDIFWDCFCKPSDPETVEKLKPLDARIDDYQKALKIILAAELVGEVV